MRTVTLFLLAATLAFAADLSGKWRFTVETEMGTGNPTFVLKQDGEKISGTYAGQLGEAPVAGTVKGDKVELQLEVAPQGDKIIVKYSGTLDGDAKMKGKVEFGSLGNGTFTAERDK